MAKAPSATVRKRKPAAKSVALADEPLTFDDDGIKRVQDIIRNARATWFALLGALVFASVTLASVKDISFFVNTVETKLPVVGISVPVVSFFWAGSLLIAALYAYFHLYLELLWQALGDFPARDKTGALLADRIEPWIVADTALRFRDWLRGDTGEASASRKRAMPWISGFVSLGLVWVFGLAVIFWFWWRSMPAHEPLLTLFLGAVLWVTVFVFGTSLAGAWTHLKFENHEAQKPVSWQWSVPLVFVAIVGATLARTGKEPSLSEYESADNPLLFGETVCGWQKAKQQESPATPDANAAFELTEPQVKELALGFSCWRRSDLFARVLFPARADLREAVFTEKPKDWQGKEIAETEFRVRWCRERGEPKCGNPLALGNSFFADKRSEEEFQAAWKERWAAQLAAFPKPDLRNVDWRRAVLTHASLEGAQMGGARLDGADISFASMEHAIFFDVSGSASFRDAILVQSDLSNAVLQNTNMQDADLSGAILDSSNLITADLRRAGLVGASLNNSDMSMSNLQEADFRNASLNGANLTRANLANAKMNSAELNSSDLSNAKLEGSDLTGARLKGTEMSRARLGGAVLIDARLDGANLRGADLLGAKLSGAWLDSANFSGARLEGADLSFARLEGTELGRALLQGTDLRGARLYGADLSGARMDGANFHGARIFGDLKEPLDLSIATLSAANFRSSAFRFARVSAENMTQGTNFRLSFGDASVDLPTSDARPCQWGKTVLTDSEYFGRWEGWLAVLGESNFQLETDDYPPIPPPPGCVPPAETP